MIRRCDWASNEFLIKYHDKEWGVPLHNDRKLFEFLILDGMQAGLSWSIILQKRIAFRKAFENFDPKKYLGIKKTKFQNYFKLMELLKMNKKLNLP